MSLNVSIMNNSKDQTGSNNAEAARAVAADDEPPQPPPAMPGSGQAGTPNRGGRAATIELEITDTTGRLGVEAIAWLERAGGAAIDAAVGGAGGEHSVALSVVDDETMSALHASHSGIEGTTDVLTFDLREGQSGPLDTEIVACLDEAARAASGGAVERELLLYLLHGVLHCLGYDDHDPDSFVAMHEREDEILGAIGVGAVFGDRPEGSGS